MAAIVMVGIDSTSRQACSSAPTSEETSSGPYSTIALMSAPAAKMRSPPQTATARTPSSAVTSLAAAESSSETSRASALAGGRSRRSVATAPRFSMRTNSPIGGLPSQTTHGTDRARDRERPPGAQAPARGARGLGAGEKRRPHAGPPLDRDGGRRQDRVREGGNRRAHRELAPRRARRLPASARGVVRARLRGLLRRRGAPGAGARGPVLGNLATAMGCGRDLGSARVAGGGVDDRTAARDGRGHRRRARDRGRVGGGRPIAGTVPEARAVFGAVVVRAS